MKHREVTEVGMQRDSGLKYLTLETFTETLDQVNILLGLLQKALGGPVYVRALKPASLISGKPAPSCRGLEQSAHPLYQTFKPLPTRGIRNYLAGSCS